MKTRSRIVGFLSALLLLVLTGCFPKQPDPTVSETAQATEACDSNPANGQDSPAYSQAAADANRLQTLTMSVTAQTTTLVTGESLTESTRQTISYTGLGTDDMAASVDESLTVGSQTVTISEKYARGTDFLTVNGAAFTGSFTEEEYLARYTPVCLIDENLYGGITAESTDTDTTVSFSQPTAPESWAVPVGAVLVDASGTAVLDENGALKQSAYDITYTYGPAMIHKTVTAVLNADAQPSITLPTDTSEYVRLSYLDAPIMLERASGYLLQALSITAETSESISSEAGGLSRTQTIALTMAGTGADQIADVAISVELVDHSRNDESTVYTQTEHFQDGAYSISQNGGEPVPQTTVTAGDMRTYCQNFLLATVLLPEYIQSAAITDRGGTYFLKLTAGEELARILSTNACVTLFGDGELLNTLASGYTTDQMECHLTIDKYTGFPTFSGIYYKGTHTIEDYPYPLTAQQEQTYTLTGSAS